MRVEVVRSTLGVRLAAAAVRSGIWLVCLASVGTGVARAAPSAVARAAPSAATRAASKTSARAKYDVAAQLVGSGAHEQALVAIDEGLVLAPADRRLLGLKGSVLMTLHNLPGALAAYRAYLATGVTGAKKRQAEELVKELRPIQTTFLDITVSNGPAQIYLPVVSKELFCTAAPACSRKPVLPRVYQVIAERPGFERWTGRATVTADQTTTLAITLVEQPSPITVRVAPLGAHVTVDDAPYDPNAKVGPGRHRIVVSLAGHLEVRREVSAQEGKAIELDVALVPLVPIRVAPPSATLVLDNRPVESKDGNLAMPPGDHTLVACARGFDESVVKIPANRPDGYAIAVDLAPHVVALTPPAPSRFTTRRKVGLVAAGIGGAAVAAGVVLWLQAKQLDRDTYALCESPSRSCPAAAAANERNQSARSRALAANIAFGVAGGAAIAAAVLWVTGAPEARVAVTPSVGAISGVDLALSF